jgi:hypothetical protein
VAYRKQPQPYLRSVPAWRAQARPLWHPAELDLRGQDGKPTPAHPRQNSGGAGPGRLNPRTRDSNLGAMRGNKP